jgi:predicted ester cyclase
MGVKADGKDIKLTGITILRMVDRKIVERWTQLDMFGLQTQLGLIKPPAPPK